ncbi:hypothetical protein AYO20_08682 [Fonsecaea nubica]|uniref:Uncharacterized protein n=1 Tax=Fonsecaea nubica TaxID=856822 RepID=A0A178CNU0_9EURO|nr:hypothetical protein AYO20_08682 [Fonsecaea nubica]OAL30595.1 hypothetical protein AYO20_08682 [Fonsecaea nubica]
MSPGLALHPNRFGQKSRIDLGQSKLEAALTITPLREPLTEVSHSEGSADCLNGPPIDKSMRTVGAILKRSWLWVVASTGWYTNECRGGGLVEESTSANAVHVADDIDDITVEWLI